MEKMSGSGSPGPGPRLCDFPGRGCAGERGQHSQHLLKPPPEPLSCGHLSSSGLSRCPTSSPWSRSHRASSCSCLGDHSDKLNFVNGMGGGRKESKRRKKQRLRTGTAGIQLPPINQFKINIRYAERGREPATTWKKSGAGKNIYPLALPVLGQTRPGYLLLM